MFESPNKPCSHVPVYDDCGHHLHHADQCERVPLHELHEEDESLCFEHCHCDGSLHLYDHGDSRIIISMSIRE